MSDPRHSWRWRRTREAKLALAALSPSPVVCWRCELPIRREELSMAELGHVVDYVNLAPGQTAQLALEHRACNRAAGYVTAKEQYLRAPRAGISTAWVSAEL